MSRAHGSGIRGLDPKAIKENRDKGLQGKFGKLFPELPAAVFPEADLNNLATAMINGFDMPKDGHDPEESGIPSLYTYFGQFIDHDLTFDPTASFQKQKDVTAVVDFRTPALDMDNVYGRGPGDQPYLYDVRGRKFLFGDPLTLGAPCIHDLQRNAEGRALIGDPRNDENTIVSQFQGLVLRFHNRAVDEHASDTFATIQKFVRHHYQYVVLNDFLPRIVSAEVLNTLKTNGRYDRNLLKIFPKEGSVFMPVEFSVAAYRLGHSMVRPGYRLNDANLIAIFPVLSPPSKPPTVRFPEGLTGFRKMVSNWGIDWGRFIDIDLRPYKGPQGGVEEFERLQFAYRLDTSLVNPLAGLPPSVADNPPPSLALRNLQRGVEFGLPSGQTVAKELIRLGVPDVKVLADDQIRLGQGLNDISKFPKITDFGDGFKGNCPLWTYVLAEAMHHKTEMTLPVTGPEIKINTPQLGPVGGRIVAEVLVGLAFADPGSYLNLETPWTPKDNPDYKLKDFVKYALNLEAAKKAEAHHHGCPV